MRADILVRSVAAGQTANLFNRENVKIYPRNLIREDEDLASLYNLMVIPDGPIIDPSLHGEVYSLSDQIPTIPDPRRDKNNITAIRAAFNTTLPIVGIGNGAAILNLMNGGKVYQYSSKHHSDPYHTVIAKSFIYTNIHGDTGNRIEVNNRHTNIIGAPGADIPHKILATTGKTTRVIKQTSKERKEIEVEEIEAIYYPTTRSLCIMWQPDAYVDKDAPARRVVRHWISQMTSI